MVTVLALLGVLGVLFVAAVLATRGGGELAEAPPDAADLALPPGPLQPEDVAGLRFSLTARGYRMAEVDVALERLAAELADRDRRLAQLEGASADPLPAADLGTELITEERTEQQTPPSLPGERPGGRWTGWRPTS